MNPLEPASLPPAIEAPPSSPRPAAETIGTLQQRADADPGNAVAWFMLGCALNRSGRPADALQALDLALTLAPYQPDATCEVGYAWLSLRSLEEASDAFEEVLASAPLHGDALFSLGSVRYRQRRIEEAAALWRHAAMVLEDPADALENLALTLQHLRRPEEERAVWNEIIARQPDHPAAIHKLATLGVGPVPSRASDAYLTRLFDAFAPEFDDTLTALGYCGPELLATLARVVVGPPRGNLDVLDAGCGTGLGAEWYAPWARRLTGVDIAEQMLVRARERGRYQDLVACELTVFLARARADFDVILCADVLNYFGALDAIFVAAAGALRAGGWLFATLEKAEAEDAITYHLEPHGRYTHGGDYVQDALRQAGLKPVKIDTAVLRSESGTPVPAWVVAAQRDA